MFISKSKDIKKNISLRFDNAVALSFSFMPCPLQINKESGREEEASVVVFAIQSIVTLVVDVAAPTYRSGELDDFSSTQQQHQLGRAVVKIGLVAAASVVAAAEPAVVNVKFSHKRNQDLNRFMKLVE